MALKSFKINFQSDFLIRILLKIELFQNPLKMCECLNLFTNRNFQIEKLVKLPVVIPVNQSGFILGEVRNLFEIKYVCRPTFFESMYICEKTFFLKEISKNKHACQLFTWTLYCQSLHHRNRTVSKLDQTKNLINLHFVLFFQL